MIMARRGFSPTRAIVSALIALVFLIVIVILAIFAVAYFAYDINLVDAIGYVRILNDDVDTNKLIKNAYTETDLAEARATIEGITVFDTEVSFTDRQMAAYINDDILNDADKKVNIIGHEYLLKDIVSISQVKFSDIPATEVEGFGELVTINIVAKLDISDIKEDSFSSFPMNLLRRFIPDEIYISSTTKLLNYDPDNNEKDYSVQSVDMGINNLDTHDVEDIIDMVDNFADIGTPEELNEKLASIFVNALIGDSENPGVAYELMEKGATGYSFTTDGTNNYFTIEKEAVVLP